MRLPELKGWDCIDHDPIEEWVLRDSCVLYWLAVHIGPPNEMGEELFYVPVATPEGLKLPLWRDREVGRGMRDITPIVLEEYSWDGVLQRVRSRIQECPGESWKEMTASLRLHFSWEFEGYRDVGYKNPPKS